MYQRSRAIKIALIAIGCLFLFAHSSQVISQAGRTLEDFQAGLGGRATKGHVISPEELQKIEDAIPTKATVKPAQPRKLLVFTLCNGFVHSSIQYATKALEMMGEKTGAFEIVQSDDMSMFKPENLEDFDAVFFNSCTELEFEDPVLRKGLIDFVKGGKGLAGIHAATINFHTWPEAAEMMGGIFDRHPWGKRGNWAVKIDDPEHPLTAAFNGKDFRINDEIFRIGPPFSRDKVRVLLSVDMKDETNLNVRDIRPTDRDAPISWVRSFGKGRVFYCSLGHNHHIFWNPTVLQHYLDGIQFALGDLEVDTRPSVEKNLAEIAAFEYGKDYKPLDELSDFVRFAHDSPEVLKRFEKRLLEFLQSDATLTGKQFICRTLSIIGTEEAVPTLAAMLTDPTTADMARYALERIPAITVDEALRNTLSKTSGKERMGIIATLGLRGDRESVPILKGLVYSTDQTTASVAVSALGQIADTQATRALAEAKEKTGGKLRMLVLDAYLKCADRLAAQGDRSQALGIYRQLYAPGEPKPIRVAALNGMVTVMGEEAVEIVVDALKGEDSAMQTVSIALVRDIPGTEITKAAVAELTNLPVAGQVQLISALADRGDRSALGAVVKAAKHKDKSVRIAALNALTALGDASTVELLAQTSAETEGAEQEAARESLYRLRGSKVDQTILANISRAGPEVKTELIRSIGRRNMYRATGTVLRTAQDHDSSVRLESLKVLGVIADQKHLPTLIDFLIHAKGETERKEAERTVIAVANRIPDKTGRVDPIIAGLSSVKDVEVKCSLLQVLGTIGDSQALPLLRDALEKDNAEVRMAVIRALSDWPTAEPMADLIKVVRTDDNKEHKVLALRGYIRLIGLDSDRPANETVRMYQVAMDLASDISEKKMVLSGLGNITSYYAMEMAVEYLEDTALQQEAEVAVARIARDIYTTHPQKTKEALQKVLDISTNASLRRQVQGMIDRIE